MKELSVLGIRIQKVIKTNCSWCGIEMIYSGRKTKKGNNHGAGLMIYNHPGPCLDRRSAFTRRLKSAVPCA
jgi:hypothetical protein